VEIVADNETATVDALKEEAERTLGKAFVTQRVDVGVDYIVTPGQSTSLELTGKGLSVNDRVMLIDCSGTCGLSEASKLATQPDHAFTATVDPATLKSSKLIELDTSPETFGYRAEPGFCPGNLPIIPGSLADGHRCYKKCYEDNCVGDDCGCDGFFLGYDTADSSALCLSTARCEALCSLTPGCHSIDMHVQWNRCFLNTFSCDGAAVAPDDDYKLRVKFVSDNTRRLQASMRNLRAADVRKLLAAHDPGISWDELLRFKDLQFTSGGEFKLCFCDSETLADNKICSSAEDFNIEVGRVHATGVQCLLNNPKMSRGSCLKQLHGGLRCYDEEALEIYIPDEYMNVPSAQPAERGELATALITFCQFAPEREANEFSFCEQYRMYAPEEVAAVSYP
jgi:hypothetical protein